MALNALVFTPLAAMMLVNALVTGLIVFKILKVFLQVKATQASTSVKGITGGTTLRHIIFVIIESGMALFAVQLIQLLFDSLPDDTLYKNTSQYLAYLVAYDLVGVINFTLIVIIRSVHFYSHFTDNIYLSSPSYQQ